MKAVGNVPLSKVQDGKVLHRIEKTVTVEEDIDLLLSIQSKIEGNTICPLGDAAASSSSNVI
jgi:NADH:ubiquinone oxidoreductase subunit F (NADH-binding)